MRASRAMWLLPWLIGCGSSTSQLADAGGDEGGDDGAMCPPATTPALKPALDLYVVFDRSASMSDAAGGQSKLVAAASGVREFAAQPAEPGVALGLGYFGIPTPITCPLTCAVDTDCGTCGPCSILTPGQGVCANIQDTKCEASDYAMADLEFTAVPGGATAVATSLMGLAPDSSTPTVPALQGALDVVHAWALDHPADAVAIALVTDDAPNTCMGSAAALAEAAAVGLAATPSVPTFVITYTADGSLDAVATSGGTGAPFVIPTTDGAGDAVHAALDEVTRRAAACTYELADDAASTEIQYTPAGAASPTSVPRVAQAADCPAQGDGWYEVPGRSAQLRLCPATCAAVEGEPAHPLERLTCDLGST